MMTQWAFVSLVVAVAAQRLWELSRSAENERRLRRAGAVEAAPGQMPWMRSLHGAWLVSSVLEVLWLDRPWSWALAIVAGSAFVAGQALRIAAMRALGERWTVKVIVLPGAPPITQGIFRYLRHPNYFGVALEIAALPLLHGAWLTALAFSAANAALLLFRIRAEERALDRTGGYREAFAGRGRPWSSAPAATGAGPREGDRHGGAR